MSKSIPALNKPALLVWAREREGLSLEEAADRIGIPAERLREWEQGTERPSMSQLRTVGDIYKRPIAVFFLREAPLGFDPKGNSGDYPELHQKQSHRNFDSRYETHFTEEK